MKPTRTRTRATLATASAALVLAASAPALSASAASPGPGRTSAVRDGGLVSFAVAFAVSQRDPMRPPAGANDWTCKPSAAHPHPVVLIHGTWENAYNNWSGLSPVLKKAGYCVFALNYGAPDNAVFKGTAHIPDSAKEVAAYVDRVLGATGARKVDLVGHSQGGGVLPRWYLRFDGGAAKTNRLIGVAPSNHGSTANGIANLMKTLRLVDPTAKLVGQAAKDQLAGSQVNTTLDALGDTVPGVKYTTIVSRTDEVVTPYRQQYLKAGPDAPVDNLTLQNACPSDLSPHVSIDYSSVMYRMVLHALDPQHTPTTTCLK